MYCMVFGDRFFVFVGGGMGIGVEWIDMFVGMILVF